MAQLETELRRVVLKQIATGRMSVKLLARKSGYGQPQVSNFLRGRKGLSLSSFESVLAAAGFEAQIFPKEPKQ